MKRPNILVNLKTYQRRWQIDRRSIQSYLRKVWRTIESSTHLETPWSGPEDKETTVVFLNDAQMQNYNQRYRSNDYPTDVLSFPVNEKVEDTIYLGDILISTDRVAAQASGAGLSFDAELRTLLLHGLLHLLGYDHETDTGQMARLERRIKSRLNFRQSGRKQTPR